MKNVPNIKIMGIGCCGNNILKYVMNQSIENVGYMAMLLLNFDAENTIEIHRDGVHGLYKDGNWNAVKRKALVVELDKALTDLDVLFIVAGMGGFEGTTMAPFVAQRAKELGIMTVALVTRPFSFEGKIRGQKADHGPEQLQRYADAILVVPNDALVTLMGKNMELKAGFQKINQFFYQKIHEKCQLLNAAENPSLSRDEVRVILQDQGESFEDFFLKN